MACRIETEIKNQTSSGVPVWIVRVFEGETMAFSTETRLIRFRDEQGARLLGRAVAAVIEAGETLDRGDVNWIGDLNSRCTASIGDFQANVERLEAPSGAGIWYCLVSDVLHSVEAGIVPGDGEAARWLCAVFASAAAHGFSSAA